MALRRRTSTSTSTANARTSGRGGRGRRGHPVTTAVARPPKWPKYEDGVKSWKGVKFDEFSWEVKKCETGIEAQGVLDEFLLSDGLTPEFCESALDLTFLAYQQGRPEVEISMLQELATVCLKEFRRLNSEPEVWFADEMLREFNLRDVEAATYGAGDQRVVAQAERKLNSVRARLRREFCDDDDDDSSDGGDGVVTGKVVKDPNDEYASNPEEMNRVRLSKVKFSTHLAKVRAKCNDDAKWEKSMAKVTMDAKEQDVMEYMDPMEELRLSGVALRETAKRIEALQLMFQQEVFGTGFPTKND